MSCKSTPDTVKAMLRQEETGYAMEVNGSTSGGPGEFVNTLTRGIMVDWCYSIADICEFNSETVEIAISNLDRFLLTEKASEMGAFHDPRVTQLATMAALYTAIKIFEPNALGPEVLPMISQGLYTVQQLAWMELEMLQALKWRINPPTAHAFVQQYLEQPHLSSSLNETERETIYELSKLQIRLAVRDYKFVRIQRSALALSCVMNAVESVFSLRRESITTATIINDELSQIANIDWRSLEFKEIQDGLYAAVVTSNQAGLNVPKASKILLETRPNLLEKQGCSSSSFEVSPRSTTE